MAEPRDDKVSAAFRAMPPVEPPPALDDAILAAARRAVMAKPESPLRRWAIPASVAAVLALSVGIAMHVDWQKPLVVDGTPVQAGSAEYPVAQEPVESPTKADAPKVEPAAKDTAIPNAAPVTKAAPAEQAVQAREEKRSIAPAPAAPPPSASGNVVAPAASPATPFPATPPPPATQAAPAPAAVDAAMAPPPASLAPAPAAVAPMRAKREAAGASVAKEALATPLERQLERIAELRAAGRQAEADEALAKFRRENPDYRIPPETWEKVKPR